MAVVYHVNKGVSRPIVFKGLKAQYIAYLAGGLVALLILFAVLYIIGLPLMVILPVIGTAGASLFWAVDRLSKRFGEHGLKKYLARSRLPKAIRYRSRKQFIHLKYRKQIRAK
ncbi:DUF4133 domain-containing protein [Sphingobacterium psychroaquaticum]|uniref:DUF4133 domain-containing protein n=1 Tax=Sphingobacterium psychroaquaticum TaxID=561061 RepID=A0A1X7IM74_9SPHI|nr:DUF4133 domain-containing protein [Sphingobacterium psychroaquaticum]SMG15698.1 protein of unknown function [Sphingobacterium psychroaquaticum]